MTSTGFGMNGRQMVPNDKLDYASPNPQRETRGRKTVLRPILGIALMTAPLVILLGLILYLLSSCLPFYGWE